MYLGIDIGTSAVKAVVTNANGDLVGSTEAALTLTFPKHNWAEQNPDDWLEATVAACGKLSGTIGQTSWRAIKAIGLSGQMHGAVLLDGAKRPLRPAILWNDGRSVAQCDALNASLDDLETVAGVMAMPGFTAPKIMWCARHEPEIYAKIAHILLPKDYVRLFLTGTLATDLSDAAGTLWLDQKARRWSDRLCAASDTNVDWLPSLHDGTDITGTLRKSTADLLGLQEGIAVAGGGGDGAAGALGIGAINEGDAFISLGTSGQLFVANKDYRPAPGTAVQCYAHCVANRWFQMGVMLNGASPMAWFATIATGDIATLLTKAETAKQAPYFLPYLTGERTPHNDASIRGGFYGLALDTTQADMMRGVVEAIAWSFGDAKVAIEKAGTTLSGIAAIGGGTRSDFLLQTLADSLSIPVERYEDAQAGPAVGAAKLAMHSIGDCDFVDLARKPKTEKIFEPNVSRAQYHEERSENWRELYWLLKPFAAKTQHQP